jgi:hypothetical protein
VASSCSTLICLSDWQEQISVVAADDEEPDSEEPNVVGPDAMDVRGLALNIACLGNSFLTFDL